MPGKDFRFNRHLKLWEEQNKLIKRTVFATLVFGLIALINVLHPLKEISSEKKNITEKLKQLETKVSENDQFESALIKLNKTLDNVKQTIRDEPWMREKDSLVHRFKALRENPQRPRSREENQQFADETIRKVADQVRIHIINPLENIISKNPSLKDSLSSVTIPIDTLQVNMGKWEEYYIGRYWYGSLEGKSETMWKLTQSLQKQTEDIPALINNEQRKIGQKKRNLKKERNGLKKGITLNKKEKEKLEKNLQEILPTWLEDLIPAELMMQIFPLILIIIEAYLITIAFILTRHYDFVARNINFSKFDKKDFATSSLWTLTDRGEIGTVLTMAAYIGFTLIIWMFFECGCWLLHSWLLTTDHVNGYSEIIGGQPFLWVGRLIFCLFIGIFAALPVYLKKFANTQ